MSIELLQKCGKTKSYPKNTIICRENEPGHSMYILLNGSVEVKINSYSNNAQSLVTLHSGSFFGEMSLLEKKPRSATVFAHSDDVVVLEIDEKNVSTLLREGTDIAYHLLCTLNKRLNDMLDRIEDEHRKFVYQYRKNSTYLAIQKLQQQDFEMIAHENPDYTWTLLKYLSSCLNEINNVYLNDMKK